VRRGAGSEKSPNPEAIDVDDLSDDEAAVSRLRPTKRNTDKSKEASTSMEEVKREIRSLEGKLKRTADELYEDGERLRRLLDSLPPSF
jgi:septal ring factor EnvC (AmiA/AmiB activator)